MKEKPWKSVTIGGFTGILMGAGTMYFYQVDASETEPEAIPADNKLVESKSREEAAREQEAITADNKPVESRLLTVEPVKTIEPGDDLSFAKAFEVARADVGPGGAFRWHGNIYNTYTVDEWNDLSDHQKLEFAYRVSPEVSVDNIDAGRIEAGGESAEVQNANFEAQVVRVEREADMAEIDEQPTSDVAEGADQLTNEDDDVRVVGYGPVEVGDGRYITVEEVDVNGQRVAIIDVDNDGVGDFAMSDINHNNKPDDGEIIDLRTGEHLSMGHEPTTTPDNEVATSDDEPIYDDGSDVVNYSL